MNPEQTGIVSLEDLPENEIFVSLKRNFHKQLEKKIRDYGIFKFCKKLNVSNRIISHWLTDGSLIRLDILNKILNFFDYKLNNKIDFIRGRDGGCIYNPKIPFDFNNKEGVRIIGGILGDGGIPSNRPNPFYSNSNNNQIKGFLKDITTVFGKVKYSVRKYKKDNSTVEIVELPALVQKIFLKLGLKKGKKVETNPEIPKFIFDLEKDKKGEFLSQIIDDEGSVNLKSRYLKIKFAVLSSKGMSNLAKGVCDLIKSLDIDCSLYNFEKRVINDKERTHWQIQISSMIELKKLYKFLNLRHEKKDKRFRFLFNTIKQEQYPKNKCTNIYLNLMKNLQQSEGYFTPYSISKETGRTIGSCRNTLLRFQKQGLIKCIEIYKTGRFPSYSKFEVIGW